jgi:hypothetical protein
MHFPGRKTLTSRVLVSFEQGRMSGGSFVAAYLDCSRGPETEMWLFSTSEEKQSLTPEEELASEQQILALFRRVAELEREYQQPRLTRGKIFLGCVSERVLRVLHEKDMVETARGPWLKFIIDSQTSDREMLLPPGEYSWGSVKPDDLGLVLSRTQIAWTECVTIEHLGASMPVYRDKADYR